jgi:CBS domain-containing protein
MRAMKIPPLSQIMTPDPVTVSSSDTLRTAIERMRQHTIRQLPVVDEGHLVGIVTDRDVRLALNSPFIMRERREDEALLDRVLIAECMTPHPVTLPPEATVLDAARLVHDRKFGGIPIVREGRLVGIVTETDLLSYLIQLCSSL